jgi:hypothetical protein
MDRDEVREFHFITPISNLGSILMHGILSHERSAKLEHLSVALTTVQGRRHSKSVPGGLNLHSYANLYFDARNPMMYYLKDRTDLIVVRVSPDVLDIPDAVVSDGNAAAEGTRFYPSHEGLYNLDSERVFALYWTDPDYWLMKEKKRARCAEILVPNLIPSTYIQGCYVDTEEKSRECLGLFEDLPTADVRGEIYFK